MKIGFDFRIVDKILRLIDCWALYVADWEEFIAPESSIS